MSALDALGKINFCFPRQQGYTSCLTEVHANNVGRVSQTVRRYGGVKVIWRFFQTRLLRVFTRPQRSLNCSFFKDTVLISHASPAALSRRMNPYAGSILHNFRGELRYLCYHSTWLVNSASHRFGYRNSPVEF